MFSRRQRLRGPVALLRTLLLLFAVLGVAGIAALLYFGNAGPRTLEEQGREQATGGSEEPLDSDILLSGSGFDLTAVGEGDKVLFQIKADRQKADRDENIFLEGVVIDMPHGDTRYKITGDEARYNRETHEAEIEGSVEVLGSGGLRLNTDWLQLREGGDVLRASHGTEFQYRDSMRGRTESLRMHIARKLLIMQGGVEIESTPQASQDFKLKARSLRFAEDRRLLRAEGNVRIDQSDNHVEANRITVRLDEFENSIKHLRALWNVRGVFTPPPQEGLPDQRISFTGWGMSLFFDAVAGDLRHLELEGRRRRLAIMMARDEAGAQRELKGRMLTADFYNNVLRSADVMGPMSLNETFQVELASGTETRKRSAEARGAEAFFDTRGNVVRLDMRGETRIRQDGMSAASDLAKLDLAKEMSVFEAAPGGLVRVATEQGELQAPRIAFQHQNEILTADNGVRTVLTSKPGSGDVSGPLPFSDPSEPVRIQSESATLTGGERNEFLFEGKVRAWQGQNVLMADQLRGSPGTPGSCSKRRRQDAVDTGCIQDVS